MKIKLYALIFILLSVILCESSTCTSIGPIEYEMVFVEGGSFRMGATAEQGDEFCADERPVHYMKINNFYIGKFEVTQEQWKRVMGENPSYFKGSDLPVEKVSWNDVQLFIEKLNLIFDKMNPSPYKFILYFQEKPNGNMQHVAANGVEVISSAVLIIQTILVGL